MLRRKTPSEWYRNLYIVPILISLVGLYFIFEGSSIRALTLYKDPYFFVKKQAMWLQGCLQALDEAGCWFAVC
jgi:cell division protein FtsW (lipid II flippase)